MTRPRLAPDRRHRPLSVCVRKGLGRSFRLLALLLVVLGTGCATEGPSGDPAKPAERMGAGQRSERITALQASIDRDHRTLATLVADAPDSDSRRFHANPELRRLADQLEAQRRELDALLRAEAAEEKRESARPQAPAAGPPENPTSPID